jgi:hypothetical protein
MLCFSFYFFINNRLFFQYSLFLASSTGNILITEIFAMLRDKSPNNSLLFARSQAGMTRNGIETDK